MSDDATEKSQRGSSQEVSRSREVLGYVFGYGSLADPDDWLIVRDAEGLPPSIYGHVRGYRRTWDIASENQDPIHDSKYYAESDTGERSNIRVATLGLEEADEIRCNGRAVPVDEQRLRWFDQREGKLYTREEIPVARIEFELDLPLWAYIPKRSAFATFEAGRRDGNVFLPSSYKTDVDAVFAALGAQAESDYRRSTKPLGCPLRDLRLVRAEGDAGI